MKKYLLVFLMLTSPALAATSLSVKDVGDGYSFTYQFSSPDSTKGYTNILVKKNQVISYTTQNCTTDNPCPNATYTTQACTTNSPCDNAVYDNTQTPPALTDPGTTQVINNPGTQQVPVYPASSSDAQFYADGLAAAKEQQWIAELGQ